MSQTPAPYYVPAGPRSITSIVNGQPIITWTTPHMRAERAFMRAAELMSTNRREEAIAKFDEAIAHLHDLKAILLVERA